MPAIVLLIIFGFSLILPLRSSAQENEPTSTPTPTPVVEQVNTPSVDQLVELESKYFRLLEQYRQQEQNYFIAKNQFLQLNTLASQEVALKETKALVDIRADVFLTYLDILTTVLQRTNGIPLEYKNPQLVSLSLLKDQVMLHKNTNLQATDRLAVDKEADRFIPLQEQLETEIYYTLSMIRLGRVQTAIDKLQVVRDAVYQDIQTRELTATQLSQKQRGIEEIDRTLEQLRSTFAPIKNPALSKQTNSNLQSLTNLSTNLSPTFTLINQTVRFLEEIRK